MPITHTLPLPARQLVADLAAHLAPDPTREAVLELASAMNTVARDHKRVAQGRSVALQVRHHLKGHKAAASVRETAATLRRTGQTILSSDSDVVTRYVPAGLAAAPLGLTTRMVQRMLRTVDGRRSLGWPYHMGFGHFMVPVAALGDGRAQFLIGQPEQEPPHPVPLPEGYST
jgi:hypothetical protein